MGHPLCYFSQLSTDTVAQGRVRFSHSFVSPLLDCRHVFEQFVESAWVIPLLVCCVIDSSSLCVLSVPISHSYSTALCLQQV